MNKEVLRVDKEVLALLMAHSWPGNIRELKHVLEYACVSCKTNVIMVTDLPVELNPASEKEDHKSGEISDEARIIGDALRKARWNKTRAAELLGISRRTLYRKLAQFPPGDLPPEDPA